MAACFLFSPGSKEKTIFFLLSGYRCREKEKTEVLLSFWDVELKIVNVFVSNRLLAKGDVELRKHRQVVYCWPIRLRYHFAGYFRSSAHGYFP